MRFPTVSRFLFCFDLQLGNKVCCWIFIIGYLAIFLISIFTLIFGTGSVEVHSKHFTETVKNETFVEEEMEEVKKLKIGLADSVGALVISSILIVVCYLFVHGIQMHDTGKMMPYVIQNGVFGVLFIGATIYFLSIIFLIKSIVFIYICICSYSLYEVFVFEELQKKENVQMNANFKEFGQTYEAESYNEPNVGYDEANGNEYGTVKEFKGA